MKLLFCNSCDTWITEDELETKITFRGTRLEPEEAMDYCKHCNGTIEDMEELDLDSSEVVGILNTFNCRL